MKVQAVIAAAGTGERFRTHAEDPDKPYFLLGGKPILAHTLEAISSLPQITKIIVVVHPGKEDVCRQHIIKRFSFLKVKSVTAGGRARSDSVANGIRALDSEPGWVLIHDGARPFLPLESLPRLFSMAEKVGAATLGVRVKPTIKRVDAGGQVCETLDRKNLWEIQTPQMFRLDIIQKAMAESSAADREQASDDAMLVEKLGYTVQVVEGAQTNIKITTKFDLAIAQKIRNGF
jgi:2-C-methyl-D-erythritol 4-phosphate cytidylyltransferase